MAKRKVSEYIFNPGISALGNDKPNAYTLISSNKDFLIDETIAYIQSRVISDSATNLFPNAVDLLERNLEFIKEETSAYIADQVANATPGSIWEGYTYDDYKCKRDIGYNITAITKDLKYGGNERSRYTASLYWNDDQPQIDGDRQVEVAVYVWLQDLISNYIFTNTSYASLQVTALQVTTANGGESSGVSKTNNLLQMIADVINTGLTALPTISYGATFAEYTYNQSKCERDTGYVIDAYLQDIRYTGNYYTWGVAGKYWEGTVPQIDGSRQPEVEAHNYLRDIINTNILTNVALTSLQTVPNSVQTINTDLTAETNSANSITTLTSLLTTTIISGLDSRPERVSGLGYIRIQGRYNEEDILLITNVTKGEIIYNFSDPAKVATVEFLKDYDGADTDFPSFEQTTDTITSIILYWDTSSHDPTDRLQIFVEEKEVRVRPYDFGTDAIERHRVANAQSMLDADFEYGLQPTKWQAIGMQRGYPSIYEVPGTEISVSTVTTDASTGTQGVGASLITVTTATAHGLETGDPFTIKGLGGTALGIGRAEGSFIVYTTPTADSFTFYAKSKVGTTNGEILSTTYTQLREAGFYTGASIGNPTFTVESNGTNGTLTTTLNSNAGVDTIPYSGDTPELGAPLVDASGAIPLGAQVTAINGTGGTVVSAVLSEDVTAGSLSFDVIDTSGILVGLAIDDGSGSSTYVTNISGQTITLSDPITNNRVGGNVTYENVAGTLDTLANGADATFNVNRVAGEYDSVTINAAGTDYVVDDVLIIPGNIIGGITPDNDLYIRVTAVDGVGAITTLSFTGDGAPADGTFTNQTGTLQAGNGAGAYFDISYLNNVFSASIANFSVTEVVPQTVAGNGQNASFDISWLNNSYSASINQAGTGYIAGDFLSVSGDLLDGVAPTNDISIEVLTVDGNGGILNIAITGTAADADVTYPNISEGYSGTLGSNGSFNITRIGTTYSVVISASGQDYLQNETFTVSGETLGGISPANDATITITTIDGNGAITGASISGTAVNFNEVVGQTANYQEGQGIEISVGESAGNYTVTITNSGSNYRVGEVLEVLGTDIGLTSPDNDLTFEVATIGASGDVLSVTAITGTPPVTSGSGYVVNDKILISGNEFVGGISPTNDVTITVTGIGGSGEITGFNITGTAPDGNENIISPPYQTGGNGINADFIILKVGTTYTPQIQNGGTGFTIGDQLLFLGSDLNGQSPANDLVLTVSSVGGSGEITAFNLSGAAENSGEYLLASGTNIAGNGAIFTITNTATVYTLDSIDSPGANYAVGQTILILGNTIGGVTPANDLTITINTIDVNGGITAASVSGTGGTGTSSYTNIEALYADFNGIGAEFAITRTGSSYSVSVDQGGTGSGYLIGNRIIILGGNLGGESPANDAVITVEDIGGSGQVTAVAITGTPTSSSDIEFISTVTFSEITTLPLPALSSVNFEALATLRIDFDQPHGIVPGNTFIVTISSDDGNNNHLLASGPYIATNIPTISSITYQARAPGTIDDSSLGGVIQGSIYARPDSFFVHRPYDGGVQLGTGGPQHGAQAIRQSKNYIRYQSGKGIMYTTGALFAPSYDLLSASADGTSIGSSITFRTDDVDHGLQVGGVVDIVGVETPGYNGNYTVSDIINERTFKVVATSTLGSTLPTLGVVSQVSVKNWHGATVKAGAYDDQNGIFWQYDGTNIWVVQRSATFQLAGLINIEPETNLVSGVDTRFLDQVTTGDRIVIRGMTHVVSHVISNTELTVTPDYRGVNPAVNAKICLITDKKVRQSSFNLDKCDGTGKSGYDINIAKMQMIGIQYSWYGAGFIDFMIRGADGNFIFAHRMRNSNVNTEAFMRSGNLPVRYEVINEGPNGRLAEAIDATQTTIPLVDASIFPTTGATIYIDNEIITFTGISGNNLTGCTRGTSLVNFQAGAQRQYLAGSADAHAARSGVIIISSSITPIISHWGSAFITDGGFDFDRGYIFSYAATGIEITTQRTTAFLLRLAPSVSNAITGDLGDRELLNRAQLLLNGIEITSDPLGTGDSGGIIVEGILNPSNYPTAVSDVQWGGLSGLSEGGQPSFAQIAPGAGVNWNVGAAVTADATTLAADLDVTGWQIIYSPSGQSYFYTRTSDALNLATGSIVTAERNDGRDIFRDNTAITGVQRDNATFGGIRCDRWSISRSVDRFSYIFSNNNNQSNPSTSLARLEAVDGAGNITISFLDTFISSGVTTGTFVDSTETAFDAGTSISAVTKVTHGTTTLYNVTFNKSTNSQFVAGEVITFNLSGSPFAQPGETIFKFIAVPGERSELDLSPIKELTNTSLGGRGTFPNGPDVLAINIYKTSGNNITGNVVLKWGEAQA